MSYQKALEAAGAKVIAFESFGDYQGTWWAHVEFDGRRGWVTGSFGSCSGCDAFEGEGFDSHYTGPNYSGPHYTHEPFVEGCAKCDEERPKYAAFGRLYLDDVLSDADAIAAASKNLEWDSDAAAMVEWLQAQTVRS